MSRLDGWELVSPYSPDDWSAPNPMPVDGNVQTVEDQSAYYRRVAQAIQETRDGLIAATNPEDNVSEAVAAFAALASQVKGDLDKIDSRFMVVSEQTAYYASVLGPQQARAAHAYGIAQAAQHEWVRQNGLVEYYSALIASPDFVPANRPVVEGYIRDAEHHRDSATATIQAQRGVVQDAINVRMAAANAAADAIDRVIAYAPLNDGVLDKLGDFFSHTLMDFFQAVIELIDQIGPILDLIATVLTVAGVLLSWCGVGEVLLGIALVVSAVSASLSLIKFGMTVALWKAGRAPIGAVIGAGIDLGIALVLVVPGLKAATKPVEVVANVTFKEAVAKVTKAAIHEAPGLGSEVVREGINTPEKLSDGFQIHDLWEGDSWGELVVGDVFGADMEITDGHWDNAAFLDRLEQEGGSADMVFDRVFAGAGAGGHGGGGEW